MRSQDGTAYVTTDHIRDLFSRAMSAMYQAEVPQYGSLLSLVADINQATLTKNSELAEQLNASGDLARLSLERHGAIRVGRADELGMLRRVFAVMGMHAVGYYDLSVAGVPVHSTAFRPIDPAALATNPFRIFTSLLRLELIENAALRKQAAAILGQRDIFTPRVRERVRDFEQQGGLTDLQATEFVAEALETFRWHDHATVDFKTYQALHDAHPLIADVVCFHGPHINHLTPRTLDIDVAQMRMPQVGIEPKAVIEGPPRRQWPILLRQTSFKALAEPICFADGQQGVHRARFGEIEQRGVALTTKGRELYDNLLTKAAVADADNTQHQRALALSFVSFPDNETELRRQELAFFCYQLTAKGMAAQGQYSATSLPEKEALLELGLLRASPLIYEDFLPVSAAGIFQSNLATDKAAALPASTITASNTASTKSGQVLSTASQAEFEQALGCAVLDPFCLYAQQEQASYTQALQTLLARH